MQHCKPKNSKHKDDHDYYMHLAWLLVDLKIIEDYYICGNKFVGVKIKGEWAGDEPDDEGYF